MVSKVIITRKAQRQLSSYTKYILHDLHNRQAATSLLRDAKSTKERLLNVADALQYCNDPDLAALGYKTIHFASHRYLFVYEIRHNIAYVEAVYHELQDFENIFKADSLNA